MNISIDWLSVVILTIGFLISMVIGFWVGIELARKHYEEHWREHLYNYHPEQLFSDD